MDYEGKVKSNMGITSSERGSKTAEFIGFGSDTLIIGLDDIH